MKAKRSNPSARPARPGAYLPKGASPDALTQPNGHGQPVVAERVNAAGLIRLSDTEAISAVPLYYFAERSRWYGPNGHGGFCPFSDSQAKALVAEYGFHRGLKDDQGNSPAERAMLWLVQNRGAAYAGPLAGYRAGAHEVNGCRLLVTESPRLLTPQPGLWPTIRRLLAILLADPDYDQLTVFLVWLAESFVAYWQRMSAPSPWPFRFCPALALFGPRGCGKTALIDLVLVPLFGGRRADPMTYLREHRFNKDLFAAPLLVLDDKGAGANLAERRERGESIKDLIWKEEQRMEGKGADALMLRPFWRLVIAGNDDDAGLQVCPALSPSLEDKLLLLRAVPADGLPASHEANAQWTAAYLLSYRPPDGAALDPRSRVSNFQHPTLVAALRDLQPEMRLLELIDGLRLIDRPLPHWEGSASQFEHDLRAKDTQGVLDRVFVSSTSAGRLLSELARMAPTRVVKTNWGGTTHYRVFPPAETR